jgi:sarcosine oxidase / L-pipecolate oxidase
MQWTGYFNRHAGYAHSGDALRAVYSACCALDVVFKLDDAVAELLYEGTQCIGARTVSNEKYTADVIVLTVGASVTSILPQIGHLVTAKAWAVGHVQLTPEEAAHLRGIPVTYARDLGFFFEPDGATNLLKLCSAGAGYTNVGPSGFSLPPEDNSFIPQADEELMRQLLRETLPGLAKRPFVEKKICWCADTQDSDYIIDFVPGKGGLVVASGDSAHAFKMLPIMGSWVQRVIEDGKQDIPKWKWKELKTSDGDISWRVGRTIDLKDAKIKSRL